MPPIYSITRTEKCFLVEESTYATEVAAHPVGAEAMPIINLVIKPAQAMLIRRDKLGTRTMPRPIAGGNINLAVDVESYLIPSGTPAGAPMADLLLKNLMGVKVIIDAVTDSGCSAGTIILTTAPTGLVAGMMLAIGTEIRPISTWTSATKTAVMAVPFTSGPSGGTAVKAVNNSLADAAANSIALYSYKTTLSQGALGCVFDKGVFSFVDELLHMKLTGVGSNETTSPAVSVPTPAFVGLPISRSFGACYLGAVSAQLIDMTLDVSNGDQPRDIPIGSQVITGVSRGDRKITDTFRVYLTDTYNAFYALAKARTPQSLFVQIGNTAGYLAGFWLPNRILQVPDIDKGKEEIQLPFSSNPAFGVGADELFIGLG